MANHKSAEKRNKQSQIQRALNRSRKTRLKGVVKSVQVAIDENSTEKAIDALKAAIPVIQKTAVKGNLHKKNASRKVSRLTKRVNAFVAAAQAEA